MDTYMAIAPLPEPPSRADSANFAQRGDAFMAALPTFATEANALVVDVNAKQSTASVAATTATEQAGIATDAAGAAGNSAGIAGTKAGEASDSAAAALASKNAAGVSAGNAADSEAAAAASATSVDAKSYSTDYAGPTEPVIKWPFMTWADTGNKLRQRRNAANSGWISEGILLGSTYEASGANTTLDPSNTALPLILTMHANAPDIGYWYISTMIFAGADIRQTASSHSGQNRIFSRVKYNGVWSAWSMVYSQSNIVGAVSQSGGVPTGSIIQSGSNANGRFIRFADGTQECRLSFTNNPTDAPFTWKSELWVFPLVFVSTPECSISLGAPPSNETLCAAAAASSPSQGSVYTLSETAGTSIPIVVRAIGRWF